MKIIKKHSCSKNTSITNNKVLLRKSNSIKESITIKRLSFNNFYTNGVLLMYNYTLLNNNDQYTFKYI